MGTQGEDEKEGCTANPVKTLVSVDQLKRGMIVRHKRSADSYVVESHYGTFVTIIRSKTIMNPSEWEIVG